ncbi:type I-E CRISPR-associated protein Cse1/CasA [Methanosalsum natronophilum]|uniref:type I-E CRISPR-associated protein Cse1/CasA n=1 Tax=Methanosalsum natronophilum TaxID=768733 RepID=UPI00216A9E8D|nr:type I-E CRISPR-associated protein Cse1/CasA [Methanosalsum natronophilum]MCS3923590.1 CRISPR system Cascade subunit CasA [Methanosalsum natronophilum]
MALNLIYDKWIGVKRSDGSTEKIAPWEVTSDIETNPIISMNTPRPDFNGSMIQFLIGLFQTSIAPKDNRTWRKYFLRPPKPDELKESLSSVSPFFDFDGDSSGLFMQDNNLNLELNKLRVDSLLMEMPGSNTLKNNADHFLKRDSVTKMCPSCCAMALFNLQLNAPSGGVGHRTSLRGGGPLTTLILGKNLWHHIWLNVVLEEEIAKLGDSDKSDVSDIFPWMGPTRTSEPKTGVTTTPLDVNPKQMYWGMPRRIKIDFEDRETGECDVCSEHCDSLISKYVTKNYGVNYEGNWAHTLSPHRENKSQLIPIHPRPGGITYRYWVGLIQSDSGGSSHPALVVNEFFKIQSDLDEIFQHSPRLWAFGFDFDNMKVRSWYESTMPLISVDESIKYEYERTVERLVRCAEVILYNTRSCIKNAIVPGTSSTTGLSHIESQFWYRTESEFYSFIDKIAKESKEDMSLIHESKLEWLKYLSKQSLLLFDEYTNPAQQSIVNPKKVAVARRKLKAYNSQKSKKVISALGLTT